MRYLSGANRRVKIFRLTNIIWGPLKSSLSAKSHWWIERCITCQCLQCFKDSAWTQFFRKTSTKDSMKCPLKTSEGINKRLSSLITCRNIACRKTSQCECKSSLLLHPMVKIWGFSLIDATQKSHRYLRTLRTRLSGKDYIIRIKMPRQCSLACPKSKAPLTMTTIIMSKFQTLI